jgi:hypothetical protein
MTADVSGCVLDGVYEGGHDAGCVSDGELHACGCCAFAVSWGVCGKLVICQSGVSFSFFFFSPPVI